MSRDSEHDGLTDGDVEALRLQLPSTGAAIYLNTGTSGPIPIPVADAMRTELDRQLTESRADLKYLDRYLELASVDRHAVAPLLGCDPETISLTHSTTEGMALVTLGIEWQAGDEIVTTSLEHSGGLIPLYVARDRWGALIRRAEIDGLDDDGIVAAIADRLTARTRLVAISHVSYQTGLVLPVARIADLVRSHGALLLIDGAQSLGAIEVDVTSLGVDAYATSGQKWLCGPEGTGALYCHPDRAAELAVTLASYGTAAELQPEGFRAHLDGRRFEFGTTNPLGFVGHAAAARFLADQVGVTSAAARAVAGARALIDALGAIVGVTVRTPPGRHATLVTFTIHGVPGAAAVDALADVDISVRSIREIDAVRCSVGYFITNDEIDRTVAAVAKLAGGG